MSTGDRVVNDEFVYDPAFYHRVNELERRFSRKELAEQAHGVHLVYWYEMTKRELAYALVRYAPEQAEELLTNEDKL
jgi:hypothetical protein